MQLTQTLRSASFRLTAAYVLLFTVSVGVLATLTYLLVTSRLDAEFRNRIAVEAETLNAEFRSGGIGRLLHAVAERRRNRLVGGLDYAVFGPHGTRLFGTLPATKCSPGWVTFRGPPDGDEPKGEMEQLAVLVTPLSQGYCLMIGDDIWKVHGFGSLVLRTFGWVVLISLTLAVAGGMFLSSSFLKRIDTINRTAEAIIEGDIRRRIPRRAAPDDLDRLAATLNRMLDRTTSLMESLRQVSSDIAHDLRTPLGRLRNMLEEARLSDLSPADADKVLERAIGEVDGLLGTFSAVLRIAQIESGSRRAGFTQISLSALVEDVCDSFSGSIEEVGKVLHTDIAGDVFVLGDQELLVQALVNLLENAVTHTPAGAHIWVKLKSDRGKAKLIVADNGGGVPPEERKRIFERFYRLERSRCTAGNGLGLNIVAAVADLHDGMAVALDNAPGLKVEFSLSTTSP